MIFASAPATIRSNPPFLPGGFGGKPSRLFGRLSLAAAISLRFFF
jgi:hypothetical protein